MTHLELIVMPDKNAPLSEDEARELIDAYLEDELDAETKERFEAAREAHPVIADELVQMRRTLAFLHSQPRPEAANDLVDRVRERVAAERDKPAQVVPMRKRKVMVYAIEAAVGVAAVAALVVGFSLGPNLRTAQPSDVEAAGLGAEIADAASTLRAPGMDRARVLKLAQAAEVTIVDEDGLIFEGEPRDVAHFVLQLRLSMAKLGGEVSGLIPDGERVRITVDVD